MAALDNPRYAAMQLQFYRALGDETWRRVDAAEILNGPVRRFAEAQLRARYKRLRRLGDRWPELDVADLHRLRILGKKLRYIALAYGSLFKPKSTNRFVGRLGDLQDCLGVLNDGVVGGRLSREIAEAAVAQGMLRARDAPRVLGMIEGWQAHAIQDRLGQLDGVWTAFASAKKFWRL
jgi:CHAD domain-containing protein